MIKNFLLCDISGDFTVDTVAIEAALKAARFVPCGASQEMSLGWVEPRGEANGPLLEVVGGQWIFKSMLETRSLPAAEINKQALLRAVEIEAQTGRKPGKKEVKEIKEQLRLELLPRAFSKESQMLLWIDPVNRWLLIGAGSVARADDVVTLLTQCVEGLAVSMLQTNLAAGAAMAQWLVSQEPPAGFSVDQECELKAADDSKATVKYGKHPLDIEEIKAHVEAGKVPVKLAMTWKDRVSFVMTDSLQIKKLDFLDVVFDGKSENKKDDFDSDVAIFTGEMAGFIPDLILALDGRVCVAA